MTMYGSLIVLIGCCALKSGATSTTVITAPSTITDNAGGLETREQGPTAWICTVLMRDSPWTSYANIRGYLEGGNVEGKNYTDLVLYPVMEIFHETMSSSRLCVYLPAADHCFPPAPNTNQVKAVKQLTKRSYYCIRFWGQASDARVTHYKQKLTAALNAQSKAAQLDLFFVSYFSDHVREVRYDPGTAQRGAATNPNGSTDSVENHPSSCPKSTGTPFTSSNGDVYTPFSISRDRMFMGDVETKMLSTAGASHIPACAHAASMGGFNAFSFQQNMCNGYNFGKDFCPCSGSGSFVLYVNMKLYGKSRDLNLHLEEGLERAIGYSEIPISQMVQLSGYGVRDPYTCRHDFNTSPLGGMVSASVIAANSSCFFSEIIDVQNCNQVCRGLPIAIGTKKNTGPVAGKIVRVLSMCGQTIQAPIKPAGGVAEGLYVFSHAGYGCYNVPEATTEEAKNCTITLQKTPGSNMIAGYHYQVALNGNGTVGDKLVVTTGSKTHLNAADFQSVNYISSAVDPIKLTFQRQKINRSGQFTGFALFVYSTK